MVFDIVIGLVVKRDIERDAEDCSSFMKKYQYHEIKDTLYLKTMMC